MSWLNISTDCEYQFLDYYAGQARLAQLAQAAGYKSQAYDKRFGDARAYKRGSRSSMDINGSAGMMLLDFLILTASVPFVAFVCIEVYPYKLNTRHVCMGALLIL